MTLSKSDVESRRNDVEWMDESCPECDSGQLYSYRVYPMKHYEKRVSCYSTSADSSDVYDAGCGYDCLVTEHRQDDIEPQDGQLTLDNYGIELDEQQPLELDLPSCDLCNERKRIHRGQEHCERCQRELKGTLYAIKSLVFGFDGVEGSAHPKPTIKKAVRVLCGDCDADGSAYGDFNPDVQVIQKGVEPDISCGNCGSENVISIDVWRHTAGYVDWITESTSEVER